MQSQRSGRGLSPCQNNTHCLTVISLSMQVEMNMSWCESAYRLHLMILFNSLSSEIWLCEDTLCCPLMSWVTSCSQKRFSAKSLFLDAVSNLSGMYMYIRDAHDSQRSSSDHDSEREDDLVVNIHSFRNHEIDAFCSVDKILALIYH